MTFEEKEAWFHQNGFRLNVAHCSAETATRENIPEDWRSFTAECWAINAQDEVLSELPRRCSSRQVIEDVFDKYYQE